MLQPFHVFAQTKVPGDSIVRKEQQRFVDYLNEVSADSATVDAMTVYIDTEIKQVCQFIAADGTLSTLDKEKAIRSLVFFLQELSRNIESQRLDLYDIPGALQSYKSTLAAVLHQKSLNTQFIAASPRRSQLMAASFSQYKESKQIDEIAVYKRIASTPEFIPQFLENRPGFSYADSLIVEAVAQDPLKMAFYLNRNKAGIQDKIRSNKNMYVQQVVALSQNKSASELLPFVKQIAEQKITTAEILEKRMDVVGYFQLMVNTLQESRRNKEDQAIFLKPLRKGIKQKALAFFVNEINDLHSSADAIRFASVKNLRAEDLYYIITSCGEEMYTSTYLGLYKRLMGLYKDQQVDSLFDLVQYDNVRTFMRIAANYNVLTDFLSNMSHDAMTKIVKRFLGGIGTDINSSLEMAMDIGDSFNALASTDEINQLTKAELQANLRRCKAEHQYLGVRLYSILTQVFDLTRNEDALKKLWATLGNYEVLKRNLLENKNDEIVQLVLFYGDEDGVASFKNFLQLYNDESKWKITKTDNWINIRSVAEHPISIYANLPLDIKQELDLRAQDTLIAYLQEQSLQPVVLVHRGHSYHLDKTLRRLKPSVRLAILGSCGSYNKSISIASFNPDVQVIGSKKTGSMSINDPIIQTINQTLLEQKDLYWPEIWKKLEERFSKDKNMLGLFNEYFPPSNNTSLFVLKLFMHAYRSPQDVAMSAWLGGTE
ncbi:MAG TPA: hypothetical protein VHM26_15460 [Chitinophagaceae bacterium]|nr:hypothetical protein [Chitinophagaceae bacterium]